VHCAASLARFFLIAEVYLYRSAGHCLRTIVGGGSVCSCNAGTNRADRIARGERDRCVRPSTAPANPLISSGSLVCGCALGESPSSSPLRMFTVILRCERRSREPRRRRPKRPGRILRGPLRGQDDGSWMHNRVLAMHLHPSYATALQNERHLPAGRRCASLAGEPLRNDVTCGPCDCADPGS
jgi:hypothetical protein